MTIKMPCQNGVKRILILNFGLLQIIVFQNMQKFKPGRNPKIITKEHLLILQTLKMRIPF